MASCQFLCKNPWDFSFLESADPYYLEHEWEESLSPVLTTS